MNKLIDNNTIACNDDNNNNNHVESNKGTEINNLDRVTALPPNHQLPLDENSNMKYTNELNNMSNNHTQEIFTNKFQNQFQIQEPQMQQFMLPPNNNIPPNATFNNTMNTMNQNIINNNATNMNFNISEQNTPLASRRPSMPRNYSDLFNTNNNNMNNFIPQQPYNLNDTSPLYSFRLHDPSNSPYLPLQQQIVTNNNTNPVMNNQAPGGTLINDNNISTPNPMMNNPSQYYYPLLTFIPIQHPTSPLNYYPSVSNIYKNTNENAQDKIMENKPMLQNSGLPEQIPVANEKQIYDLGTPFGKNINGNDSMFDINMLQDDGIDQTTQQFIPSLTPNNNNFSSNLPSNTIIPSGQPNQIPIAPTNGYIPQFNQQGLTNNQQTYVLPNQQASPPQTIANIYNPHIQAHTQSKQHQKQLLKQLHMQQLQFQRQHPKHHTNQQRIDPGTSSMSGSSSSNNRYIKSNTNTDEYPTERSQKVNRRSSKSGKNTISWNTGDAKFDKTAKALITKLEEIHSEVTTQEMELQSICSQLTISQATDSKSLWYILKLNTDLVNNYVKLILNSLLPFGIISTTTNDFLITSNKNSVESNEENTVAADDTNDVNSYKKTDKNNSKKNKKSSSKKKSKSKSRKSKKISKNGTDIKTKSFSSITGDGLDINLLKQIGEEFIDIHKIERRLWIIGTVVFLDILKRFSNFIDLEVSSQFITHVFSSILNMISDLPSTKFRIQWYQRLGDLSRTAIALYPSNFMDWKLSAEFWYKESVKYILGHGKLYYHLSTVQQNTLGAFVNLGKSVFCRDAFLPSQQYMQLVIENIYQRAFMARNNSETLGGHKYTQCQFLLEYLKHGEVMLLPSFSQSVDLQNVVIHYFDKVFGKLNSSLSPLNVNPNTGMNNNDTTIMNNNLMSPVGNQNLRTTLDTAQTSHFDPNIMPSPEFGPKFNNLTFETSNMMNFLRQDDIDANIFNPQEIFNQKNHEQLKYFFRQSSLFAESHILQLVGFGALKNPFALLFELPKFIKERKDKKEKKKLKNSTQIPDGKIFAKPSTIYPSGIQPAFDVNYSAPGSYKSSPQSSIIGKDFDDKILGLDTPTEFFGNIDNLNIPYFMPPALEIWLESLRYINITSLKCSMIVLKKFLTGPLFIALPHLIPWVYFLISLAIKIENLNQESFKEMWLDLVKRIFPWNSIVEFLNILLAYTLDNYGSSPLIEKLCKKYKKMNLDELLVHFRNHENLPEILMCWGTLWFDVIAEKGQAYKMSDNYDMFGIEDPSIFDFPVDGIGFDEQDKDGDRFWARTIRVIFLFKGLAEKFDRFGGLIISKQTSVFCRKINIAPDHILRSFAFKLTPYFESSMLSKSALCVVGTFEYISPINVDLKAQPPMSFIPGENIFNYPSYKPMVFDYSSFDKYGDAIDIALYVDNLKSGSEAIIPSETYEEILDRNVIIKEEEAIFNDCINPESVTVYRNNNQQFKSEDDDSLYLTADDLTCMFKESCFVPDTTTWLRHYARIYKVATNDILKFGVCLSTLVATRLARDSKDESAVEASTRAIITMNQLFKEKKLFQIASAKNPNVTSSDILNPKNQLKVDYPLDDDILKSVEKIQNENNNSVLDNNTGNGVKHNSFILITDDTKLEKQAWMNSIRCFRTKFLFSFANVVTSHMKNEGYDHKVCTN